MKYRKDLIKNLKIRLLAFLVLILALTVALLMYSELCLRPILKEYTLNKAEHLVNNIINNAVCDLLKEQEIAYSDIALLSRDESGNVTSLEIDMAKINTIKAGITSAIAEKMKSLEEISFSIPIGTLTGNKYLVNRGPRIPFSMQVTVYTKTDFESNFSDAGINQTLHQILIKVYCGVYVIMPPFNANSVIDTDFIAAQSVIVGKVPDSYTNVFEGEPSDITDIIFDYADID